MLKGKYSPNFRFHSLRSPENCFYFILFYFILILQNLFPLSIISFTAVSVFKRVVIVFILIYILSVGAVEYVDWTTTEE